MDLIGISFDIYVLSWSMRQFTLTQSDSFTITPKTPEKLSESFHKNYFDFDSPYDATASDVISQLPNPVNFFFLNYFYYLFDDLVRGVKDSFNVYHVGFVQYSFQIFQHRYMKIRVVP